MEMRCYRNILGRIAYKDHVTNEKVRSVIKHYIRPHEDLTTVKNRKLRWFGHVTNLVASQSPISKEQWRGREREADRGNDGLTMQRNGQGNH